MVFRSICNIFFVALFGISAVSVAFGQKKSKHPTDTAYMPQVKFGVVLPEDFSPELHAFDSTAPAVILFEKGFSYFRENKDGWFQLVFEKQQRLKVVNKNGMDAANFTIPQYKSPTAEEKIEKLVAITYNLENGTVVQTQLNPADIYKDQMSKTINYLKFGLPAVKEGSILEISYTVVSDFLRNLRGWNFQGQYPRLHSEYTTRIPNFFYYLGLKDGFLPFTHTSQLKEFKNYNLFVPGNTPYEASQRISLSTDEIQNRMVMQKVPAIKPENFISTVDNYITKVRYQLSEYRFPNQQPQPLMLTWPQLAERMLANEDFGLAFSKNNPWIQDELKKVTDKTEKGLEQAKAIYNYWRNEFTLTEEGGMYLSATLKDVLKNKKGNTADGNLMLTLLLKSAGYDADPFIISTRDNGWTNDMYPLINEYNYVITRLSLDGKLYYLDATNKLMGFGRLPLTCYNGHGRTIKPVYPTPDYLVADSILENKTTIINMFGNAEKPWETHVSTRLGYYESTGIRETVKEKGKEGLLEQIKKAVPDESEVTDLVIKEETDLEKPINLDYNVNMESLDGIDILYINPLMGEATKDNPFAAAERYYPVEMPYAFKESIITTCYIPEGFQVEELPKSTRVKLPDNMGSFDFLIQKEEDKIWVRSVIHIPKATFAPEAYDALREFFVYIVKKHSEQIVLKRKS